MGKEQSDGKQKLEGLKKKRAVLKARIQQIEAREKTVAKKQDLRRKILVGTFVLEEAEKDGSVAALYQKMGKFLARNSDRTLFELAPLPKVDGTTSSPKRGMAGNASNLN